MTLENVIFAGLLSRGSGLVKFDVMIWDHSKGIEVCVGGGAGGPPRAKVILGLIVLVGPREVEIDAVPLALGCEISA